VDWVLLRAVAAQERVTFTTGVRVTGLIAEAAGSAVPPRVTGVRTDGGDIAADLVVDASGRRSGLDTWLTVFADWLEVLDPLTGVFPMGGLHNTLRRLVADGTPVVTGLHAIGDTVCTTNPTLARGLALAMTGAADLAAVLASHGDDPYAQALALDGLVTAHVAPFYEEQAAVDSARLAQMRNVIFGDPAPPPDEPGASGEPGAPDPDGRVTYAQVRAAMPFDPVVFRAFWRVMGMTATPREVYADPDVVARARDVLAARGGGLPLVQPSRGRLLAALGA
jgi:hypothetical protein